ncbi:MAG: tetratricopeptide repeat protein, partial [Planctomycetota bacterium]
IDEADAPPKPINSTEGFLAITRHLNTDAHYKTLLSSTYFQNTLCSSLGTHILSRFHCELPASTIECLQHIALLSSSATAYLLFGDTSIYDNLFENVRNKDENAKEFANGLMQNRIILCALLGYGADYIKGRVLCELKSKRLAGQLLSMNLKVAYEEAKAFELQVGMPLIRAYAGGNLRAGEMTYGKPEFFLRQGTIYMHLDLDELAEQTFDQALSLDIPDSDRAIGLNNKGLIYLRRKRYSEAIPLFEEATKHNPDLAEPKRNLKLATAGLSEQKNVSNPD